MRPFFMIFDDYLIDGRLLLRFVLAIMANTGEFNVVAKYFIVAGALSKLVDLLLYFNMCVVNFTT